MAHRVALFGGSFDPIHHGHLIAARSVAEWLGLERVIFLPTGHSPHKHAAGESAGHRGEMVKLAIEGEEAFAFSDHDLTLRGPTYTVDTVRHFAELLGSDTQLHWIIGADSLADLPTWYDVAELVDRCQIVTAARPGFDHSRLEVLRGALSPEQVHRIARCVLETPRIDISATDIRKRAGAGQSIRYLVPERVREYIERMGLYGAS